VLGQFDIDILICYLLVMKKKIIQNKVINKKDLKDISGVIIKAVDERFKRMDTRIDDKFLKMNLYMDERFKRMDTRIDDKFLKMNLYMDERFKRMDTRINDKFLKMNLYMDERFKEMDAEMKKMSDNINKLVNSLDSFLKKMTDLEDEFTILKKDVRQIKEVIKTKLGIEII